MKKIIFGAMLFAAFSLNAKDMENINTNTSLAPVEQLTITQEWDKVFPKSEKVDHKKVTFVNRYGITLVADMYMPKIQKGNFRQSLSADLSGPSRSRAPAFTPKSLQSVVS